MPAFVAGIFLLRQRRFRRDESCLSFY